VQIPTRTTIAKATSLLAEKKVISAPFIFKWTAKIYSFFGNKRLYAGYYRFSGQQSHWQLMRSIFSGKQVFYGECRVSGGYFTHEICADFR
jgi:cell division protein YceG involved in septum cleavage